MRCRATSQAGQSLVAVIGLTSVAALLVIASLAWAKAGTGQSTRTARSDLALEAAEAGVQLYTARMVEDPMYARSYVDPAEDPRVNTTSGGTVAPGSTWPAGADWTYSGASQTWKPLNNARFGQASYSLRITSDPGDSSVVLVQSTARIMPSGGQNPVVRSVQARIEPISISDFQMISDTNISYGTGATTTGKIYTTGSLSHDGTAQADIYARGYVCKGGLPCYGSNATSSSFNGRAYDRTTNPSADDRVPPIDFTSFTQSLVNIKAAAQATGYYKASDSTAAGWMIQFLATGQVRVWKLTGTSDLSTSAGSLGCPTTLTPAGGSAPYYMYFEQPVVVGNGNSLTDACSTTSGVRDSVVDGRITVATTSNMYVGGNISYETPGDDVLGLIASGSVVMTSYAPYNLSWRAATLAQSGRWTTQQCSSTDHGSLVFTGSTAVKDGGCATMFSTRQYDYDTTLRRLRPPLFPTLEGTWDQSYWREVTPPA